MKDNRFECGCERGDDCTKTTMCKVQSAIEDEQDRIAEMESERTTYAQRLCKEQLKGDSLRAQVRVLRNVYDQADNLIGLWEKGHLEKYKPNLALKIAVDAVKALKGEEK